MTENDTHMLQYVL